MANGAAVELDDIDLDDPTSWPEDIAALEQVSEQAVDGETPAVEPEAAEKPEVDAEQVPEKATDEPEKGDVQAQGEGDAGDLDAEGVLTKDGKKVIPFSVLADTRKELQSAKDRLAELESAGKPTEEAEAGATEPAAEGGGEDPFQQRIETLEALKEGESDDPVLLQLIDTQIETLKDNQALRGRLQQEDARTERAAADSVQEALDNSPLLAAWGADREHPEFHRHATRLHAYLLENDPEYAEMSWADRFDSLPKRVESVHGESPQGKALREQQSQAGVKAAEPKKGEEEPEIPLPLSLSAMPGGEGADDGRNSMTRMERMSGADMQVEANKAAAAGRLDEWLAG